MLCNLRRVYQFGYLYKQYVINFNQVNYMIPSFKIPTISYSTKESIQRLKGISPINRESYASEYTTIMESDMIFGESHVLAKDDIEISKRYSMSGYRPEPIKIENPPTIMKQICELLKAKEHSCMTIIGPKEHKFEWCQKEICLNDMHRRNDEQEELISKLKKDGHICYH